MTCNHAYVKPLATGTFVCLDCGSLITPKDKDYDTGPLIMPPYVFQITEQYWKERNPWPNISREMALNFKWYGSMLYNREYLVMPIYRPSIMTLAAPVFYSARCLTECEEVEGYKGFPPKYSYPLNRRKEMWRSWDFPSIFSLDFAYAEESYLLGGEGVADAAWLSLIGPSVALLGNHGSLDHKFILVLDGDVRGINAAFEIVQSAKRKGLVDAKTAILPPGFDPTDLSIKELRDLIYEQTGVSL